MSGGEERRPRGWVSPAGLAITAAAIAALYAAMHALGLRPYTAILSGTSPPGASASASLALGLVYTALHFAFVIAAPILAIAAALMGLMTRRR